MRPLPYAESAYGNPEAGETVLNVTDGKLLRLLVDDELFDVRYGDLLEHERVLDFRDGMLRRTVHWRSPAGQGVIVHEMGYTAQAAAEEVNALTQEVQEILHPRGIPKPVPRETTSRKTQRQPDISST